MFSFDLKLALLGLVSASATITVGGCASSRDESESVVALTDLPAAARATIEREAMGNAISEVEKEIENGKITYSADTTIDGREYDIEVGEDGVLLEKELDDGEDADDDGEDEGTDTDR